MSNWKASNYESGSEFRGRIGLQFFAEDGGADTGADMDGDFGSDFEAALTGSGLESQQDAGQDTDEGADGRLGSQQPEGQPEEPENDPAGGQEPPAAQQEQQPQLVPMKFNGREIMLPAEAVEAIGRAVGGNAVELLEKGMNYDSKAERELRLLDQFAAASGMNRAQYLSQLENMQRQQEIAAEVEKARGEFPEGTPDAALQEIAKSRVAGRYAAEQQQRAEREQKLAAVRQRAEQAVQEARRNAEIQGWDDYEQLAGVHEPKDIPPRVLELVQKEGMTPVAAHWRCQAEQARQQNQIEQKNERNRRQSAGSMAGGDAPGGFEADFMSAFRF